MKITLCGSVRPENHKYWHEWNGKLTLAGHLVYSVSMMVPNAEEALPEGQKQTLDLVHLAKIEESDAIFVLNVNDYIGESTKRELAWARIRNKKVYWLQASRFMNLSISTEFASNMPGFRLDLGVSA